MVIVETKRFVRPDTATKFWANGRALSEITEEAYLEFRSAIQGYKDSGQVSYVTAESPDGLNQELTVTYVDLETYSAIDALSGIGLDAACMRYMSANNITGPKDVLQYTQTGIDQPFTCTTTYTFQDNDIRDSVVEQINRFASKTGKLVSLIVTELVIIAVMQYLNSEDFSTNFWSDIHAVNELEKFGVTRTIKYELV